jgi:molecular chaperone DnaK
MVQEAERNAEADRIKREQIETKNQADSICYQAEKQIKDFGDKIDSSDKSRIEALVKDLREAINKDDHSRIKDLSEKLKKEVYELSAKMYQSGATGASASDSSTQDGASGDGDVIDADFTESK